MKVEQGLKSELVARPEVRQTNYLNADFLKGSSEPLAVVSTMLPAASRPTLRLGARLKDRASSKPTCLSDSAPEAAIIGRQGYHHCAPLYLWVRTWQEKSPERNSLACRHIRRSN